MGEEIKTNMDTHTIKEFWGGDEKGVCLHVTSAAAQCQEEGFVQLTMEEAAILHAELARFVVREAKRRQALLRRRLDEIKAAESTVFGEVANLPSELLGVDGALGVNLVSKFCPRA